MIQSDQTYKSIPRIDPPVVLGDLVVLSGLNGTGKSQLLEGVAAGTIRVLDGGEQLGPVKHVDHVSFAPTAGGKSSTESFQKLKSIEDFFGRFQDAMAKNKSVTWKAYSEAQVASARKSGPGGPQDQHFQKTVGHPIKTIESIAKRAGKTVDEMAYDDILMFFQPADAETKADIFAQDLPLIFMVYHRNWLKNHARMTRFGRDGKTKFLAWDEFERQHGEPPWQLLNKIIDEANLEYEVDPPESMDAGAPIVIGLTNKRTSAKIAIGDLSSGEKAIMSLVLSLYNSKLKMDFPRLLLMDEPDAHLHPALTKQFFDVIQNVFIREKGMKIIMTTHSPSTVALAPEVAIFVMSNTAPKIRKTTKDQALRLLTIGVPTLSVNYESRRQVFVEGPGDRKFFEAVYAGLQDEFPGDISLSFDCFGREGEGKANCDQVKDLVNILRTRGVGTAFGIIDWDSVNEGNEHVMVLGKGIRYSIENYLLDPLLLAAFLLREGHVPPDSLGAGIRWLDLSKADNDTAQSVADAVLKKVRAVAGQKEDGDLVAVEYLCGITVNIPRWYLGMRGHDLMTKIREAFPPLKAIKKDGELTFEIIRTVVCDAVKLIPKEVPILLKAIAGVS